MERKQTLFIAILFVIVSFTISGYGFVKACIPESEPKETIEEAKVEDTETSSTAIAVQIKYVSEITEESTEVLQQNGELAQQEVVAETEQAEETELTANGTEEVPEISEPTEQGGEEPMYTNISVEDITWLEMITRAEAGICGEEARQGVAATVLARAKMKNMSIYDVIFESGQFTPAIGGKIYLIYTAEDGRTVYEEVTPESAKCCKSAVLKAIQEGGGEISKALGQEPIYFYAPSGLSDEEAAKRESISNKYETDGLMFYAVWD